MFYEREALLYGTDMYFRQFKVAASFRWTVPGVPDRPIARRSYIGGVVNY